MEGRWCRGRGLEKRAAYWLGKQNSGGKSSLAYFLARSCLGLALIVLFCFVSPPFPCVSDKSPKLVVLSTAPYFGVIPCLKPPTLSGFRETHTGALFKNWKELVTLTSQSPAFRHVNPCICSVSLGKSPFLSVPGMDISHFRWRQERWVLHFPECSRRGGWRILLKFERRRFVATPRTASFPSIHPSLMPTLKRNREQDP